MPNKIAILGAGSWGTALAVLLARNGCVVALWARRAALVRALKTERENRQYLPGVPLPEAVTISTRGEETLAGANLVIYAVPSHAFRSTLVATWAQVPPEAIVVNVAKGLEEDTLLRQSEVFMQETGEQDLRRYVTLSGPSHAEEVGRGLPTAVVASSPYPTAAEYAQETLMAPSFRVYTNPDIVGVELGGALKNIIALGTGIADGLELGDNTKAALMTRGLAEITRLGVRMGANPLTFGGLAGVGDLIVTCTSRHSRNRRAGMEIGRGQSLAQALETVQMVVEGVRTTWAAYLLARKHQVEMPITEQTYRVLFEELSPSAVAKNLMERDRTREIEEVAGIDVWWSRKQP
jgi:glycerol-3-phosphate dehydrogenase (NAD(P)+)